MPFPIQKKFRIPALVVCLLVFVLSGYTQSGYRVRHFSRQDYQAANQNWSVDSDPDGYLYVGNNDGLLIYDGTHWQTYRNQDQTIVRSVHHSNSGRIYTGSFEAFGYWQKEEGKLVYHSLKPSANSTTFHNGEIWKILEVNGKIYFQGFSSLFVYDGSEVRSITLPGSVIFLLEARGRLFIQAVNGTFYEITGEKLIRLDPEGVVSGTEIKTILPYGRNDFLIGTTSNGLFLFNGKDEIRPFKNDAQELLKKAQVNNGIAAGNRFFFGTIVNGIVVLSAEGKIIEHLNTGNILQNNTVLSMCQGPDGSIWVGLDRGIERLIPGGLLTIYQEQGFDLGSVYSAVLSGGNLYVGTNRGVFIYKDDPTGQRFRYAGFLENSQGQVWDLRVMDGVVFCGHTRGTYTIENAGIVPLSSASGGFCLKEFRKGGFSGLIQSTYSPLVLYTRIGKTWKYLHQVNGFQEPARFIEPDHLGNFWVSHAVKGVYKLKLNERLDSIASLVKYNKENGLPADLNLKVFKIENRVVITTGVQLYTWDDLATKLRPYEELNRQLNGFETATHISPAGKNRYWFIRKNDLGLFEISENKVRLLSYLFLPLYGINMVDGYENLISLDNTRSLLCLDNGFAIIREDLLSTKDTVRTKLIFREIFTFDHDGNKTGIFPEKKPFVIPYARNSISVSFAAINSSYFRNLFQYKLSGLDNDWSEWSESGEVTYSRLPQGRYQFQVRTYSARGSITDPVSFEFIVQPAWYLSNTAYMLYLFLFIGILLWIRYLVRNRILRQHKRIQLESDARAALEKQQAEQEIIKLQNEKLQAEISHKNIQLADSTMAIIRKNELLIEIKEEVEKQKESTARKGTDRGSEKLLSLINKNISSDDDWTVFEALFDQAHENFFKRLKAAYPDLTQSDLKLCAYLKLNLSSKEIAPLLNITFRGVETRRYRLRRRLLLESDANLVEFIMQF